MRLFSNVLKNLYFITVIILGHHIVAQDCSIGLSGQVFDEHTGKPMPFVSVYEVSSKRGLVTDDMGEFSFESLCLGPIHLKLDHVGCEQVSTFIELKKDTSIQLFMHHHAELLDEVTIKGEHEHHEVGKQVSVSSSQISKMSDRPLADVLADVPGMNVVRNGSTIAKPVLHGMSSNRLTILNDGVALSGQQWGADHAPELDADATDRITIVKGVNTLAYNGTSIGGVIKLEHDPIPKDPHIHGKVNYRFNANDLGHTLHNRLEKHGKFLAWRINLKGRMTADGRTVEHYLSNTANRELSTSLTLEKEITKSIDTRLHLSRFDTDIGILRGSHIGNLTDLREAIGRDIPFFTESTNDYKLINPRQKVTHYLGKWSTDIQLRDSSAVSLIYAVQFNNRREFDIRRGDRDHIPTMNLEKVEHLFEVALEKDSRDLAHWDAGMQYRYVENTNDPETGILPLIPDYSANYFGAYVIRTHKSDRWEWASGLRLDSRFVFALPISETIPRVFLIRRRWDHMPSASISLDRIFDEHFKLGVELGYRGRAPEVNELFSFGLHQGVAGIEEGDENLPAEQGLKGLVNLEYHLNEKYFFDITAYSHLISNYILLEPQDQFRLTIRGSFPVFQYLSKDAVISGIDLRVAIEHNERLRAILSYSHIRGVELKTGLGLVGIPSDQCRVKLRYAAGRELEKATAVELGARYVLSRADLLTDNSTFPDRPESSLLQGQDFLPAPPSYLLAFATISRKVNLSSLTMDLSLTVDNALNTVYRDYLDRMRYFADSRGREVRVGLKVMF